MKNAEKIIFLANEKTKAELKIKLHRDGMSQTQFFNGVIAAYLSDQGDFLKWFSQYRVESNSHGSKSKRNMLQREEHEASQNIKKFGLNKDELESIFDLIENPRLEP